jgi:hypothetical protein
VEAAEAGDRLVMGRAEVRAARGVAVAVANLLRAVTRARLREAVAAALVLLELELELELVLELVLELEVVAAAGVRLRLEWRCRLHDKIYKALDSKGRQIV